MHTAYAFVRRSLRSTHDIYCIHEIRDINVEADYTIVLTTLANVNSDIHVARQTSGRALLIC